RARGQACYEPLPPQGPAMSTSAVYPGSFDPITNGHVDIVRRSLQVFSKVIVGVAFNPNKDSSWFTPEERVAMIRETFRKDGDRKTSARLRAVKPSATFAMAAEATALRNLGRDVIDLSVGEPDFDTPEHVKAAAREAMARGLTKYTPIGGTDELKDAISTKL